MSLKNSGKSKIYDIFTTLSQWQGYRDILCVMRHHDGWVDGSASAAGFSGSTWIPT